jgi:DNA-binding transcriptional LysR family regulator
MTDLDRIDWNLLPALDALLQERNVSRAARRLSISQSAASGALSRLRRHFDDQLLDRQGGGYVLTPLAQQLVAPTHRMVDEIRGVIGSTRSFDPATSKREFVVLSSEYGQTVFGAALIRRMRATAPHTRLTFRGRGSVGAGPDWLSGVDGWIGPRDAMPDKLSSGLFTDRWVCVVDRDDRRFGDRLEVSSAAEHPWVIPTSAKDRDLPWRKRLLDYGLDLNISVTTESFGSVPYLVAGTDHIGIVQASLLARLGDDAGVRMLEVPWSMPPLSFTLWWHENREHDLAHVWFRRELAACMEQLDGVPVP